MRRAFSILFIVLFGLGPLAAALDGNDVSLPACCRRHGVHHCAMSSAEPSKMAQLVSQNPALTAPSHCPMYPPGNASPSPTAALTRSLFIGFHATEPAQFQRVCGFSGSIYLQIPTLRGPPASLLA